MQSQPSSGSIEPDFNVSINYLASGPGLVTLNYGCAVRSSTTFLSGDITFLPPANPGALG